MRKKLRFVLNRVLTMWEIDGVRRRFKILPLDGFCFLLIGYSELRRHFFLYKKGQLGNSTLVSKVVVTVVSTREAVNFLQ